MRRACREFLESPLILAPHHKGRLQTKVLPLPKFRLAIGRGVASLCTCYELDVEKELARLLAAIANGRIMRAN